MRVVQITWFGAPEVLDVVDLPDPVPGQGQQLYEVNSQESTSPTPTRLEPLA
jgi:NADPH:quinone reductase-like Zn-dependent oxidoreductase